MSETTQKPLSEWLEEARSRGNNGMISLNFDQSLWVIEQVAELEGQRSIFEQAAAVIEPLVLDEDFEVPEFTPAWPPPEDLPHDMAMYINDCEQLLAKAMLTYNGWVGICGHDWARKHAREQYEKSKLLKAYNDLQMLCTHFEENDLFEPVLQKVEPLLDTASVLL